MLYRVCPMPDDVRSSTEYYLRCSVSGASYQGDEHMSSDVDVDLDRR